MTEWYSILFWNVNVMTGSDHEDKSHTLNLAEQEDRRCQDPFFFFFNLSVWPHRAAHGISVPQLGMEPIPAEVEVLSLNY